MGNKHTDALVYTDDLSDLAKHSANVWLANIQDWYSVRRRLFYKGAFPAACRPRPLQSPFRVSRQLATLFTAWLGCITDYTRTLKRPLILSDICNHAVNGMVICPSGENLLKRVQILMIHETHRRKFSDFWLSSDSLSERDP